MSAVGWWWQRRRHQDVPPLGDQPSSGWLQFVRDFGAQYMGPTMAGRTQLVAITWHHSAHVERCCPTHYCWWWTICKGKDPKPNPSLKGSPSSGASLVPFQNPAINKESLAEQLLERASWDPACESHMVWEGWVEERCQESVGICQAGAIWEASSATCHVINGARSRADISVCSSSLCSSWKSSCIGLGP